MSKYSFCFLILLSFNALCQQVPADEFQARNETDLVEFEFALPPKTYEMTNSDLLVKWHVILFDLLEQTNGYTPNVAARTMAYVNLAAYEAMLPGNPDYQSLSGQIQQYKRPEEFNLSQEEFDAPVAVNNAVFYMVDQLFATAPYVWMEKVWDFKDSVNQILESRVGSRTFEKSKNYGLNLASMIYEYSKSDGGHQSYIRSYDMEYRLRVCDACFEIHREADLENTGPLHPGWVVNRTFMKENATDFGIVPKVVFSKYPNSPFYKMAMEVYEESKTVNPGNKKYLIANFWDDASGFTYTAPGHSFAILTMVLRKDTVSLARAAELYCRLGLAVNDALIASWISKYKQNLIRPVAYINRYIDSAWKPKLLTPPFPEFPSGHSVQSAAMATVLTESLGDQVPFTDYSKFWVGEPRKFSSFWEAADEVSISRLYGGIHFRDALDQGQDMGRLVGNNVLKLKFLK